MDATVDAGRRTRFPIVALGASAGGLPAFEQFFRAMPADSAMAFVLLPHLDPDHASLLSEILPRSTTLPVVEAIDGARVEPRHVYVLPPNREMTLRGGALHLAVPCKPPGQRLPINAFMTSLAEDQGEWAVGIVLSGNGKDGTLGMGAILGAGGVTLAQNPTDAEYAGMPTSVIEAGHATHVLAATRMPEVLLPLAVAGRARKRAAVSAVSAALMRVFAHLRTATGHDFARYKKSTIVRRIERRMLQLAIDDIHAYAQFLGDHPREARQLFKDLLINVTYFFRDPEAFAVLKDKLLERVCADKPDGYVLRVWVAACAGGQEAYSVAMVLSELQSLCRHRFQVKLYATDLHEDAISTARKGLYPLSIAAEMSPERLDRYFHREEDGYRVKKSIREMVVFAVQNISQDPPFTHLDLLVCRNLMIYLEPDLQARLMAMFHYALKPSGLLFLSPSESISSASERFVVVDRKWKLYAAQAGAALQSTVLPYSTFWAARHAHAAEGQALTKMGEEQIADVFRKLLLQHYAPSSVVVDEQGNLIYSHGETGKYFRPAPGPASLNILDMAYDGLRELLGETLFTASAKEATSHEVLIKADSGFHRVKMTMRPFPDLSGGWRYVLLSFQEADKAPANRAIARGTSARARQRIEELEQELADTQESQRSHAERQQAANEELQSINEELQSTNEELETSKEELQSVNEELTTVNAELHAKIEQLSQMQNDMKNLLESINIATLFLDQRLAIRRFTREATRIFRLVPSDLGRPLGDIKCDIQDDDLLGRAHTVLETLAPYERLVRVSDGTWYLARIQPYRTMENLIDGVVLTFTDITHRVEAELAVQRTRELAEGIVDTVREPLVVLNEELKVVCASPSFYQRFQLAIGDVAGKLIYELDHGAWRNPRLRALLDAMLRNNHALEGYALDQDGGGAQPNTLVLNARRMVVSNDSKPLILLALQELPGSQVQ